MSRLGLLLYSKRKELKLTQRELSERIGVCQGCISNYERGVTNPSLRILFRLVKALHISWSEFNNVEIES